MAAVRWASVSRLAGALGHLHLLAPGNVMVNTVHGYHFSVCIKDGNLNDSEPADTAIFVENLHFVRRLWLSLDTECGVVDHLIDTVLS